MSNRFMVFDTHILEEDMPEVTNKQLSLSEAFSEVVNVVKRCSNTELKQQHFSIVAEVTAIRPKVYGGNQYVNALGDEDSEIQLIVPQAIASEMKIKKTYTLNGTFEIPNNTNFGLFQFRVLSATLLGESLRLEAKKKAANEIIEKGYLHKYKYEFSRLRGLQQCRVAIVTSQKSLVIQDVLEVFKSNPGVTHSLIPVKLNDAQIIAEGITYAGQEDVDVILIVRGGGNENDFEVFDNPEVVRAIYECKLPVIVGIGHSENLTFADQVADRSETTPSKAARFLIDQVGYYRKPKAWVMGEEKSQYSIGNSGKQQKQDRKISVTKNARTHNVGRRRNEQISIVTVIFIIAFLIGLVLWLMGR